MPEHATASLHGGMIERRRPRPLPPEVVALRPVREAPAPVRITEPVGAPATSPAPLVPVWKEAARPVPPGPSDPVPPRAAEPETPVKTRPAPQAAGRVRPRAPVPSVTAKPQAVPIRHRFPLTVRVEPDLHKALTKLRRRTGRTTQSILHAALRRYLAGGQG